MIHRCAGHSRFSVDGIQAASGSLDDQRRTEDELTCEVCIRALPEYVASACCNRLVCRDCGHIYHRGNVYCSDHIPDAGESEAAA
jgi:hypothetical protein